MDFVGHSAPAVGPAGAKPFGNLDRAVEGNPRHHLGMGEMLRWAADLPDALVRLIPDTSEMLKDGVADGGAAFYRGQPMQIGLVESIEDLTKDIELSLV